MQRESCIHCKHFLEAWTTQKVQTGFLPANPWFQKRLRKLVSSFLACQPLVSKKAPDNKKERPSRLGVGWGGGGGGGPRPVPFRRFSSFAAARRSFNTRLGVQAPSLLALNGVSGFCRLDPWTPSNGIFNLDMICTM